jgi:RNA polymerase sigma factor (sigma-70 family)
VANGEINKIIKKYDGLIRVLSKRYLWNKNDVDECMQDTKMRLNTHLNRYDAPITRGTVYTYTKQAAITLNRKESTQKRYFEHVNDNQGETILLVSNPLDAIDGYLGFKEKMDMVTDQTNREILIRRFLLGFSRQEIGDAMGLTRDQVRHREQNALSMIGEKI